ncbi:MAG: C39 family peptidase [Porcipelethomonas sp.]
MKKITLNVLIFIMGAILISCGKSTNNSTLQVNQIKEENEKVTENIIAEIESSEYITPTEAEIPDEYIIKDFPIVFQMPELPTGCEITAMTMILDFYGYNVDKTVMAEKYLPTAPLEFYRGSDGKLYGSDMEKYFVGDPFSEYGCICGTEAIVKAADDYLEDQKSLLSAKDITGTDVQDLYKIVSCNIPVVVWVTIGMEDRYTPDGWFVEGGRYVESSTNDHGAVLIGYTKDKVIIADPIVGKAEYEKKQFESVFKSRLNQCVILSLNGMFEEYE